MTARERLVRSLVVKCAKEDVSAFARAHDSALAAAKAHPKSPKVRAALYALESLASDILLMRFEETKLRAALQEAGLSPEPRTGDSRRPDSLIVDAPPPPAWAGVPKA